MIPQPAGVSSSVAWEDRQLGAGSDRPLLLLILPDAANTDQTTPIYYYLPKVPQLARKADDRPIFSLTLILSRQPSPDDDSIYTLVEHGILTFELTLAVRSQLLAELPPSAQYQPLFAREVVFTLDRATLEARDDVVQTDPPIASLSATGAGARAAFSLNLDRSTALAVLAALDGQASNLNLLAKVTYRTAAAAQTIRLNAVWVKVYDFLKAEANEFSVAELQAHFAVMLEADIVAVSQIAASGAETPIDAPDPIALFKIFLQSTFVILDRLTPEFGRSDPQNRYALRSRPHPMFRLDTQQTLSSASLQTLELKATLEQAIVGALEGLDRDQYIHLVGPTGGSITAAPRRVQVRHDRQSRSVGDLPRLQLAAAGGTIQSLSNALQSADQRPTARSIGVSDLANRVLVKGSAVQHWAVQDAVVDRLRSPVVIDDGPIFRPIPIEDEPLPLRVQSLPIVENPGAAIWRDRLNSQKYWYAPAFELIPVAPNENAATSAFCFTYTQAGVTADGKPALSGTLRLRLRQTMRSDTQAALEAAGNPEAHPIPEIDLAVSLSLPFVDVQTNATKTTTFIASVVAQDDQFEVTVALSNDWVRLCYGSLAFANFQTQPARLSITYTYAAYVPVNGDQLELVYGAKAAITPIDYSPDPIDRLTNKPFIHAASETLRLPVGNLKFQPEALQVAPRSLGLVTGRGGVSTAVAPSKLSAITAVSSTSIVQSPTAFQVRPELEASPILATLLRQTLYVTQTLAQQSSLDLFYLCSQFGGLYLQAANGTQTAIGCQDALYLGKIVYRQYEEMPELRHEAYQVWRSLQQPGHFLVVPTAYRITRYSAATPDKAYRPAILMYTVVDAKTHSDVRVVVQALLQPDLAPYLRRDLLAKLSSSAASPLLIYPTEIDGEIDYTWTLSSEVEVTAINTGDALQISLSTSGDNNALLLQTMLKNNSISGKVSFTLPDRTVLTSNLKLELDNIAGPWAMGAIEVDLVTQPGAAKLTNRIESEVHISDLMLYGGTTSGQSVPVDQTLAAGEAQTVSLPIAPTEAYPVYVLGASAATISELPIFVEDIYTNVIFVNLVSYANHNLQKLDVLVRLKDIDRSYPVTFSEEQRIGTVDLTLPLTTYLTQRIIRFQVIKTLTDGTATTTNWQDLDLKAQGNVVNIIWSLIQ